MTSFRSDHQRYTGSVRRRRKIPLLLRRELFPIEAFHKRGISHLGMLTLELPTKKGEKKKRKTLQDERSFEFTFGLRDFRGKL